MANQGLQTHCAAWKQGLVIFAVLAMLAGVSLAMASGAHSSARPNPGRWSGHGVVFHVKRSHGGLKVIRFRTTYTLGCQTPQSGGLQHSIKHLRFRIGGRGRFSGTRTFPLRGSKRNFKVRVKGRFTARRKARGKITWLFPGCRATPRKWSATGPRRYPDSDGDNGGGGGGGGDACIWIPLPDGSGFICI